MTAVVIGGRLQGVEAAYLAKKAGWDTVVADKDENVPAAGICDRFECGDAADAGFLQDVFRGADFIIPAVENFEVLTCVKKCADSAGIPLVYDEKAYRLSSSKIESNRFFAKVGVPVPKKYPRCGFPLIVKPSGMSGSAGVTQAKNEAGLQKALADVGGAAVVEEYLSGPSYSLEVISYQGVYLPLQITDLRMDKRYDCSTVIAPTDLSDVLSRQFDQIAMQIAQNLHMDGIFDIEVIQDGNLLKVLEIDARLPSQTPTAVYNATGVNMLDVLWHFYSGAEGQPVKQAAGGCVYFHVRVTKDGLEVCGEHIMSEAGRLHLSKDFFGADEALTNYVPGCGAWAATLIVKGQNRNAACHKAEAALDQIRKYGMN